MLVADDFHLGSGVSSCREGLLAFFVLCATGGVPLPWNKTENGDVVFCVGLELLHSTHEIGIADRRAEWFTLCTWEVADSHVVNINNLEEGLGRIMLVTGALEPERPFLGPFFKFLNAHPRGTVRVGPPCFKFFLTFLSRQVPVNRHVRSWDTTPRFDAQAPREQDSEAGGQYGTRKENRIPGSHRGSALR